MQFRDLQKQYQILKEEIDKKVQDVMASAHYISGPEVAELEKKLAEYVGVKHCVTCANGTDALTLALKAWGVGAGDAIFVPDFTFFASGEVVAFEGATPIFVDTNRDTFNLDTNSLEDAIKAVIDDGQLTPKVIIAVDLFGLPADFEQIKKIAYKYQLLILEDGAQGFGGSIDSKKACSFGDISTTSFFPAKPLGCYGDGGAVFTDNDEWAQVIRSLAVHGKGSDKYDNVRIGMNSRLDTIQAAILQVKMKAFAGYELERVNQAAQYYNLALHEYVKTPRVPDGFCSSWAQYTIMTENKYQRDALANYLKQRGIPSMIYYRRPLHLQGAFEQVKCSYTNLSAVVEICDCVLSLPIHPYISKDEQDEVINAIKSFFDDRKA